MRRWSENEVNWSGGKKSHSLLRFRCLKDVADRINWASKWKVERRIFQKLNKLRILKFIAACYSLQRATGDWMFFQPSQTSTLLRVTSRVADGNEKNEHRRDGKSNEINNERKESQAVMKTKKMQWKNIQMMRSKKLEASQTSIT